MNDAHPGYVTVADLMRIYGLSRTHIYYLASVHRWRRYRLDGKIRYHRQDVWDTLEQDTPDQQVDRNDLV